MNIVVPLRMGPPQQLRIIGLLAMGNNTPPATVQNKALAQLQHNTICHLLQ